MCQCIVECGLLTGTRSAEGIMASGHANRANRPNTWLHRPATRREVLTCQPGAVHTWHEADVQTPLMDVRFEINSGHDADVARRLLMTQSGHYDAKTDLAGLSLTQGTHSPVCGLGCDEPHHRV